MHSNRWVHSFKNPINVTHTCLSVSHNLHLPCVRLPLVGRSNGSSSAPKLHHFGPQNCLPLPNGFAFTQPGPSTYTLPHSMALSTTCYSRLVPGTKLSFVQPMGTSSYVLSARAAPGIEVYSFTISYLDADGCTEF